MSKSVVVRGAALAACMAVSACGLNQGPSFQIGLRRVALNLSFRDESKALPPTHTTIILPPLPSSATSVTPVAPTTFIPPPAPPVEHFVARPACPVAPPNSHPLVPASVFVYQPPKEGTYLTHNTGTFTLTGALTVTLPYPKVGMITIANIHKSQLADTVNGPTDVITYDDVTHGVDGSQTTTTYRTTYSPSALVTTLSQTAQQGHAPQGEMDLVKTVTINAQGTTTFVPNPPVEIMGFKNGQGTSWNSAGMDQATGTSMVVQGQTVKRRFVDLCGSVFDTYEISSTERIVNLRTGFSSQTAPGDPNVYDVATQYGGLFIRSHISTTSTYAAAGKGGAGAGQVTIHEDQVFDSITPQL